MQTTLHQTSAPPALPIEHLVPEALNPLVPFFFPQGVGPNNTQAWPPAGTSDAPPIQSDPAGIAGTAPGATPPNKPAAGYPYGVPVPEGLKPVARSFFPEWFEDQNEVS